MTSDPITLGQALAEYLQSIKNEQRRIYERYIRSYVDDTGETTLLSSLTLSHVELYAETRIKVTDPAAPEKVAALKAWFQYLKKKEYTDVNYGTVIRPRRVASRAIGGVATATRSPEAPLEMTAEGIAALQSQMELLDGQRSELVVSMEQARQDGDLRENAPYHAAKEQIALVDDQRRKIDAALRRAVVVDRSEDDRAQVGSTVTVTNLEDDRQFEYRLVGAREANATDRKISVESPVGKQLLGRRPGEEVSVQTPRGQIQYRVERVSNS